MEPTFVSHAEYREFPVEEMRQRAAGFYAEMRRRRSVRDFSDRPVPREILEDCLRAAGTAPSGANGQPWHFVVVSDPEIKHQIRVEAEKEEQEFYQRRAPIEWLHALKPLGTDERKPFLERAPYLIVVFARKHEQRSPGEKARHYYVLESVGIAAGILITAVQRAGLASLVYTPGRMGFLNEVLARPAHERPFLTLVVGYPAEDARVPVISKKRLAEYVSFL